MTDTQLAEVEAALAQGPRAHGFPTEMWTLARVADVIEKVTGVRHGQTPDLDHPAGPAGLEPAAPGPARGGTR